MKQMEEAQDSINDLFPEISEKEMNTALRNAIAYNENAAKSLYIELVFWGEGLRGASKTNTLKTEEVELWVERFFQILETYITEEKPECQKCE